MTAPDNFFEVADALESLTGKMPLGTFPLLELILSAADEVCLEGRAEAQDAADAKIELVNSVQFIDQAELEAKVHAFVTLAIFSAFAIGKAAHETRSAKKIRQQMQERGRVGGKTNAKNADNLWRLKCKQRAEEILAENPTKKRAPLARQIWDELRTSSRPGPADPKTVTAYLKAIGLPKAPGKRR